MNFDLMPPHPFDFGIPASANLEFLRNVYSREIPQGFNPDPNQGSIYHGVTVSQPTRTVRFDQKDEVIASLEFIVDPSVDTFRGIRLNSRLSSIKKQLEFLGFTLATPYESEILMWEDWTSIYFEHGLPAAITWYNRAVISEIDMIERAFPAP